MKHRARTNSYSIVADHPRIVKIHHTHNVALMSTRTKSIMKPYLESRVPLTQLYRVRMNQINFLNDPGVALDIINGLKAIQFFRADHLRELCVAFLAKPPIY